jgi:hypothetical protein
MKKARINILTPFLQQTFMRQLPDHLEKDGFLFSENAAAQDHWDMVVVYEGIEAPRNIRCRKGGCVFISGEPPASRTYSSRFLAQFDHVISSHHRPGHPSHHHTQQALPWHFGLNRQNGHFNFRYQDISEMAPPLKSKKISMITSDKTMMPGHIKRMAFLQTVRKEFKDGIDIFGQGIHPVSDKACALLPYQFSICIENAVYDHYWTEKLADSLIAFTIPIYHGCRNLSTYFNPDAFISIDIDKTHQTIDILKTILLRADEIYTQRQESLTKARTRLLEQYNLFPMLARFFDKYVIKHDSQGQLRVLYPSHHYPDHHLKMGLLRLKRYTYRRIGRYLA